MGELGHWPGVEREGWAGHGELAFPTSSSPSCAAPSCYFSRLQLRPCMAVCIAPEYCSHTACLSSALSKQASLLPPPHLSVPLSSWRCGHAWGCASPHAVAHAPQTCHSLLASLKPPLPALRLPLNHLGGRCGHAWGCAASHAVSGCHCNGDDQQHECKECDHSCNLLRQGGIVKAAHERGRGREGEGTTNSMSAKSVIIVATFFAKVWWERIMRRESKGTTNSIISLISLKPLQFCQVEGSLLTASMPSVPHRLAPHALLPPTITLLTLPPCPPLIRWWVTC